MDGTVHFHTAPWPNVSWPLHITNGQYIRRELNDPLLGNKECCEKQFFVELSNPTYNSPGRPIIPTNFSYSPSIPPHLKNKRIFTNTFPRPLMNKYNR